MECSSAAAAASAASRPRTRTKTVIMRIMGIIGIIGSYKWQLSAATCTTAASTNASAAAAGFIVKVWSGKGGDLGTVDEIIIAYFPT